ncbi:hypothetical protein QBK99_23165 [Corticibacterium sp. UT-5YL-CI-8]|nr:hypothetical protein [Tianweitania sp. UT-5YL-CI-8]
MKKARIDNQPYRYLYERDGRYVFRRVIPLGLRPAANGKTEIKESVKKGSPAAALTFYMSARRKSDDLLSHLAKGGSPGSPPLAMLRETTAAMGLTYADADALIDSDDLSSIVNRLRVWDRDGKPRGMQVAALLGATPDIVTLEDMLAFYLRDTEFDRQDKNAAEQRASLRPYKRAVERASNFWGKDRDISRLKRADAMEYRRHLNEKIRDGAFGPNTASKMIGSIRKLINAYNDGHGIHSPNPLEKISFKQPKNKRPSFSTEYIKSKWLQGDPFCKLNFDARCILFTMLDSGAGIKEICGLLPDDIVLDHEIPHIIIRDNALRKVKTNNRNRTVPLIGHALSSMKEFPKGFPRYQNEIGHTTFSNTTNKFLRENDLLQTSKHSCYCLRHSFIDRMRRHLIPLDIQKSIVGHGDGLSSSKSNKDITEHYGEGYDLTTKLGMISPLAMDFK